MKRAWITESARDVLIDLAGRSAPVETGGILVGVLRDGDPWVVMVVEIEDPTRGPTRFTIPHGVTPAVVEITRQIDGRFGYVGDWHSHPADIPPSTTDKATLRKSARQPRSGKQPLLSIVVRAGDDGWVLGALADSGSGARPVELMLTGALPEQSDAGSG